MFTANRSTAFSLFSEQTRVSSRWVYPRNNHQKRVVQLDSEHETAATALASADSDHGVELDALETAVVMADKKVRLAKRRTERAIARPPEIRGLRFCTGCKRCMSRDRNASFNIGLQFKRLVCGMGPIRKFTSEERALHDAETQNT